MYTVGTFARMLVEACFSNERFSEGTSTIGTVLGLAKISKISRFIKKKSLEHLSSNSFKMK